MSLASWPGAFSWRRWLLAAGAVVGAAAGSEMLAAAGLGGAAATERKLGRSVGFVAWVAGLAAVAGPPSSAGGTASEAAAGEL